MMINQPVNPDELLSELSLAEKVGLTSGASFWRTKAVERLNVSAVVMSDGPHGLRFQPESAGPETLADHVGFAQSNPATCFPPAAGLGCTWDADLLHEVGVALAREARRENVDVLLGPGINIKRHPFCGRNFEYMSEDPLVSGVLGAAWVRGLQSQGVGASVKHFAVNNQETDRMRVSADVDEQTLREIYLPAFEHVVREAKPWTVMSAYNRINGVHAAENAWLLDTVLRKEWGFEGVVVSDWGAVNTRRDAVNAGTDLEMPGGLDRADASALDAALAGELDASALDRSVARILELSQKAAEAARVARVEVDAQAHHQLARVAATRSAVLLKNENDVLPIDVNAGTIALIGEFAQTPRYQGAGSSQVNPTRLDNALDQLVAVAGKDRVLHARGFSTTNAEPELAEQLRSEAVALGQQAETVVLFLGLPDSKESEGFDRESFDLPTNQITLLRALTAVNDRVVVVLCNGATVEMASWYDAPAAILEAWLPGQAGGGAIVDLLTGKANPGGKLTETIPLRIEDVPSHLHFPGRDGHVRYGEGVFVGYRYYDTVNADVAYPFGHGLSYTTFEYGDLSITREGDARMKVCFNITNTGTRSGIEVAQLYVTAPAESVTPAPAHQLRGFAAVSLEPGETRTVELSLVERDFSYWSTSRARWAIDSGTRSIQIGASSRDIRLAEAVTLDTVDLAPLTTDSTVGEWLADPVGSGVLREVVEQSNHPVMKGLIEGEMLRMVRDLPLRKAESIAPGEFDTSELLKRVESRPVTVHGEEP